MSSALYRIALPVLAVLAALASCRADPRVDGWDCSEEKMLVVIDPSIVSLPDGTLFASAGSSCMPSLLIPGACAVGVELRRLGEVLGQYTLRDDAANGDEAAGDGLYSRVLLDSGADEALFWAGPSCSAPPVSVLVE